MAKHPGGRPRTLDDAVVARMRKAGIPAAKIAEWFRVNRRSIYTALKREEGGDSPDAARMREALENIVAHGEICLEGGCCVTLMNAARRVLEGK